MAQLRDLPEFRGSFLDEEFSRRPFGFVDIGSMGGVHPSIAPAASLTHVLCFEPNRAECEKLRRQIEEEKNFAAITVLPAALAGREQKGRKLHLTASAVNSSLLEPDPDAIRRYGAANFAVRKVEEADTRTLDNVLKENPSCRGDFLKVDAQGADLEILEGAKKTLEDTSMTLICEVNFMNFYLGQPGFADVDLFLRQRGFFLYGLYPHYRSARKLDRRRYRTEERLQWADAVYFRDPLETANRKKDFTDRQKAALLLGALVNGYFEFALEAGGFFYGKKSARFGRLRALAENLSEVDQKALAREAAGLSLACRNSPQEAGVQVQAFAGRHRSNADADFAAAYENPGKDGP